MSLSFPSKDPDEVLDYKVDWLQRLDGDTIVTSTFSFETQAGLVKNSESHTTTTSTVWLSAGTLNNRAVVNCRITTAGGRTMDQSVSLRIRSN